MNLIDPKCEEIVQKPGLQGLYEQIELVGRTCYKSKPKYRYYTESKNAYVDEGTDTFTESYTPEDFPIRGESITAESFVRRMIKSKHTAMLEHGTCYLYFKGDENGSMLEGDPFDITLNLTLSPYAVSNHNWETHEVFYTTNLRVLVELRPNDWEAVLERHMVPYDDRLIKRKTIKITTDRGVSHELVRHRVFSFAQESQRYCNYGSDDITFIRSSWGKSDGTAIQHRLYYDAEIAYKELLNRGWKPQQARSVLPNAVKTEICMTGTEQQWEQFLQLRYHESTGKVHPDMKVVATMVKDIIENNEQDR